MIKTLEEKAQIKIIVSVFRLESVQ